LSACGAPADLADPPRGRSDDPAAYTDDDGDGYAEVQGDCDDENPLINPGKTDWCDGVDNDCDGRVDQAYDKDKDGWSTCRGDCRDDDPEFHPQATEVIDGLDNDCDELVDNHTPQYDDDEDGYSELEGDCDDTEPLIGPGSIEVQVDPETGDPEWRDNDCDGNVDEAPAPCLVEEAGSARQLAAAAGICGWVVEEAEFPDPASDPRSRGVFLDYGSIYLPIEGQDFAVLSTGIAGDSGDPGFVSPQGGTSFFTTTSHPDPQGAPETCGAADQNQVNDYTELELQLQVPFNASSFSFDFNFMSAEFPEYVCSAFDDTFLAFLESEGFTGNVSFDAMGSRVSINVGFFDQCDPALGESCEGAEDLAGTGYETEGGGTGWLTTTAPVTPGEHIRLRFVIFDEGDAVLDSAVLIDNFRWGAEKLDSPITVE